MLRLYVNFFQPSTKLLKKTRVGSRTSKKYDRAQTPYQRLLVSDQVRTETKEKLTELYRSLDPLDLFERLGRLQQDLYELAIGYDECPVQDTSRSIVAVAAPVPKAVVPDAMVARIASLKPPMRSKRAYTKRVPCTWRTSTDPMEGTYEYAKLVFQLDPQITGKELLMKLSEKFPGKFNGGELKTVQRRLSGWRRESVRTETLIDCSTGMPKLESALTLLTDRCLQTSAPLA